MTTAKKSTSSTSDKSARKNSRCWPGFEPVPGKAPREKGSCKPEPGEHSKATRRATQKAAATSKLEKAGNPNPKTKR
jgi:hypothetical protein